MKKWITYLRDRKIIIFTFLILTSCYRSGATEDFVALQIQDRNNLTETITNSDKLDQYARTDFLESQPYKKILRMYRNQGKNFSKITTYHPNGSIWQYLEVTELRAFGAYKEWHPNGQLHIDTNVIGGTADVAHTAQKDWLFDGNSKVFDENGNLIASIPYKKGALEGTSTYYYASGNVEKVVPYSGGLIEGVLTEYFPNEEIFVTTTYIKGNKDGKCVGHYRNGQTAWEEKYAENLLVSGNYYNLEGESIAKVIDGTGIRAIFEEDALTYLLQIQHGYAEGSVRQFTKNGDLQSLFYVKAGKKSGEELVYYLPEERCDEEKDSPLAKLSIQWGDGMVHGSIKTWYNQGQLQSQREFCRNQKMGPSLAWYRDGSLMLMEEYEENHLMHGKYYKRNALESISGITNGNGLATLYDENGIFLRKVIYVKGEPVNPDD